MNIIKWLCAFIRISNDHFFAFTFRSIPKRNACPTRNMWKNCRRNCPRAPTKHQRCWKKHSKGCHRSEYQQFGRISPQTRLYSQFIFRWKNYVIRGIFTLIMILGFCLIIYGGPLALMITVISENSRNSFWKLIEFFYSFADIVGASEVLRRDHLDWIPSVSHPWIAMVPQFVMVFFVDIQLLLLRREFGRLLWRCDKSCWIFEFPRDVPSIFVIHTVLHRFRMVCAVSSQEILHETIQFVRLDPCGSIDCCHTELLDYSKYIWRWATSRTAHRLG